VPFLHFGASRLDQIVKTTEHALGIRQSQWRLTLGDRL
ncbi:unnamed protein product, partial [Acidithrix sp. C25]